MGAYCINLQAMVVTEGRWEEHQWPGFRHLTCPAKTPVVVAAKRLINRVSQSISINWGEFPVAALCKGVCFREADSRHV